MQLVDTIRIRLVVIVSVGLMSKLESIRRETDTEDKIHVAAKCNTRLRHICLFKNEFKQLMKTKTFRCARNLARGPQLQREGTTTEQRYKIKLRFS